MNFYNLNYLLSVYNKNLSPTSLLVQLMSCKAVAIAVDIIIVIL